MNYRNIQDNSSIISLVVSTETSDCLLNNLSLVQIGQSNLKAKVKKSISSRNSDLCSFENLFAKNSACLKKSEYPIRGIKLTFSTNSLLLLSNPSFVSPDFLIISKEYLSSSSSANSGENNVISSFDDMSSKAEPFQKKVNNTLESTTNFIYKSPFFFNSSALPFLPALCSCTAHLVVSSSFFNFCSVFSFQDNSLVFSEMHFLTKPDQFISEKCSISCLTSSGIDNVIDAIVHTSLKKRNYVNIFKLFLLDNLEKNNHYILYEICSTDSPKIL